MICISKHSGDNICKHFSPYPNPPNSSLTGHIPAGQDPPYSSRSRRAVFRSVKTGRIRSVNTDHIPAGLDRPVYCLQMTCCISVKFWPYSDRNIAGMVSWDMINTHIVCMLVLKCSHASFHGIKDVEYFPRKLIRTFCLW